MEKIIKHSDCSDSGCVEKNLGAACAAPQCDVDVPDVYELAIFLSRYSAHLLGSGCTCIRLEKNLMRIAHSYGMEVELTIMSRHVHISLWCAGLNTTITSIATVHVNVISYNVNTQLSELSWDIADHKLTFDEARKRFCNIIAADKQNCWLVLLLVAIANAAFCRLFNGDPVAMGFVGLATAAGYFLKLIMLRHHCDARLMVFVCSCLSGLIGALCVKFNLGSTPDIALATCALYLVPGIPFLNSFSDLLYRHYLCAFSRFMDAMVLTFCLSMGLSAAMLITQTSMF